MSGQGVNPTADETADQSDGGAAHPSDAQLRYLRCGLGQPGGKLPLFDDEGQAFNSRTIQSCVEKGWAEPWFDNPVKPGWLVCRLTETGRALAAQDA